METRERRGLGKSHNLMFQEEGLADVLIAQGLSKSEARLERVNEAVLGVLQGPGRYSMLRISRCKRTQAKWSRGRRPGYQGRDSGRVKKRSQGRLPTKKRDTGRVGSQEAPGVQWALFIQFLTVADLGAWGKLKGRKGNTHHTHTTAFTCSFRCISPKLQPPHACSPRTDSIWREMPRQSQHLLGPQHCMLARSARDLMSCDGPQPLDIATQ